jgi:hypothetical protein
MKFTVSILALAAVSFAAPNALAKPQDEPACSAPGTYSCAGSGWTVCSNDLRSIVSRVSVSLFERDINLRLDSWRLW